MPIDPVDLLLESLIADGGRWPPRRELDVTERVRTYRAFLETDRDRLRELAGWPADRPYRVDPLPELIADAWAHHIFGEDLTVTAADDADAGLLDLILEGNGDLLSDLHAAERRAVGEGEAWWRVYADTDVADVPLLEWHGRDEVLPLYLGGRLLAAAIISELENPGRGGRNIVYRHLEVHADGYVEHVLFRGTRTRIGQTVPLEEHPELAELAAGLGASAGDGQRWTHGLPMLVGRVTNGRAIDRRLNAGVSDFARISDYLLDLNEAVTIGAENARLTAKRRLVIPEEAVRAGTPELIDRGDGTFTAVPRGGFDAGEDVIVATRLDAELGAGGDGPYKVLEYAFDAEALILYKRDLIESAVTRVGLTPRYLGVSTGEAPGVMSGTAYKLSLIPTTKAGKGKGRVWDDSLPRAFGLLARLDALPVEAGGFGRGWSAPELEPGVDRGGLIVTDELEESQVDVALAGAGLRSRRTSIERQHPEWSADQVDEELARIEAERPATSAAAGFGLA